MAFCFAMGVPARPAAAQIYGGASWDLPIGQFDLLLSPDAKKGVVWPGTPAPVGPRTATPQGPAPGPNEITFPGIPAQPNPGTGLPVIPFEQMPKQPTPSLLPPHSTTGSSSGLLVGQNSAAPEAPPQPTSFLDAESGLHDCDIPFDQLQSKSPTCQGPAVPGRRCEVFSPSQFPEVVAITIHRIDGQFLCTGTVIAANWVVTAAHCFLGSAATDSATDLTLIPPSPRSVTVKAANALMLAEADRVRAASRVVVYRKYGGRGSKPPYSDDLALIELAQPFPATAVQPAGLVSEFDPAATLAGYGLSNADGGTNERFNVTWPVPLNRADGQFSFNPSEGDSHRSAFCQGDSGGPAFARRNRGCKNTDKNPDPKAEQRPRRIEGIISFDDPAPGQPQNADNEFMRGALICVNARNMVMQDITLDERREWICTTTSKQAQGC